jgi:hypothetical protein
MQPGTQFFGRSGVGLTGVIISLLLLPSAVSFSFLGFQVTGWAWLGGLVAAVFVLARSTRKPSIPVWLWAAWFAWVLFYSFAGLDNAYQSAAQIVCPIVVGLAASTFRPGEFELRRLGQLLRRGAVIFLGIVLVLRIPMLLLGRLPDVTGLAPEAISSLLFQSLFLSAYLLERRKLDLVLYLCFAAVPVVAVTRGPILGSFLLLVLVLTPLAIRLRLLVTLLALTAAVAVFHTQRMQRKMFWSGEGTLRDLSWHNSDFKTSGREAMWAELRRGIAGRPWFGHGGNADATALIRAGFPLYLPHNDWLRVLYNYGIAGCGLYVLAMGGQLVHGLRAARRASPAARVLFFASLSAFVPYVVLMTTDNILIYAQSYGNLHFLMLGLAYGSLKASQAPATASRPSFSTVKRSSTFRPRRATWRPRTGTSFPLRRPEPTSSFSSLPSVRLENRHSP